ncbi:uncharacterized protein LOC134692588 [Mytilus trossulus]|uniref:uncharacterized protein LOC134692588 n=1 Tax=Mytilus trossulus TaxID=6551 RepID=UPI0030077D37
MYGPEIVSQSYADDFKRLHHSKGITNRFSKNDFRLVFTKNEIVLLEKLPNINDFTVEISYKILRFEFNMLHEPKCKWGNVPQDTDVEISDDIQRLINATNSIIKITSTEVTENYSENLLEEIKKMVTRIDSFLNQDDLGSLYNSLCLCEIDSISILQDLSQVKAIEESLPDTESDKRERYSRVSMAIIETFPNILRGVIQSIISASDVYQRCITVLNTFYVEQQRNLALLQRANSYDSLDITLIYRLLRQFSLIPSPTQGWGSKPDVMDFTIGDDVERIRFYRNELAHRSDTNIDKTMFNEYFEQFRDIGNRMDLYINNNTNYEQRIIWHKTCRMDAEMQAKYENTMRKMENIKLRYEKKPIKVYWGESFDKCLMNLRSLLQDEKLEGRPEIRVQIIFQKEEDVGNNIEILNSLKEEINEGLSGIEFIVATKGSVVLNVDILLEMLETDEKLQTILILFLERILERIPAFSSETIDILVLPVEENKQWNKPKTMEEDVYVEFDIKSQLFESDDKMIEEWNKPKTMGEQVYLEFDIEAHLFETDESMVEQFRKISDVIIKHSNEGATNQNIALTILPIDLENVTTKEQSSTHAETLEGK